MSSDETHKLKVPQKIVRKRSSTLVLEQRGPKRAEIVVDTPSAVRVLPSPTNEREETTADEDEDNPDEMMAIMGKREKATASEDKDDPDGLMAIMAKREEATADEDEDNAADEGEDVLIAIMDKLRLQVANNRQKVLETGPQRGWVRNKGRMRRRPTLDVEKSQKHGEMGHEGVNKSAEPVEEKESEVEDGIAWFSTALQNISEPEISSKIM